MWWGWGGAGPQEGSQPVSACLFSKPRVLKIVVICKFLPCLDVAFREDANPTLH